MKVLEHYKERALDSLGNQLEGVFLTHITETDQVLIDHVTETIICVALGTPDDDEFMMLIYTWFLHDWELPFPEDIHNTMIYLETQELMKKC